MNRPSVMLTMAIAVFGAASPALSQGGSGAARGPAPGAQAPSLSAKPYARLFGRQASPVRQPFRLTPAPTPMPRMTPLPTCGLIVVPADPNIDPTFERRPADDGTRFSMRSMPWLCK